MVWFVATDMTLCTAVYIALADPCSRQTLVFTKDTVVYSKEPITTTDVLWLAVGGAKVTIIAPSVSMHRTEVRRNSATQDELRRAHYVLANTRTDKESCMPCLVWSAKTQVLSTNTAMYVLTHHFFNRRQGAARGHH